jgi:hypothetical protein
LPSQCGKSHLGLEAGRVEHGEGGADVLLRHEQVEVLGAARDPRERRERVGAADEEGHAAVAERLHHAPVHRLRGRRRQVEPAVSGGGHDGGRARSVAGIGAHARARGEGVGGVGLESRAERC